jgi:hypothetical protein
MFSDDKNEQGRNKYLFRQVDSYELDIQTLEAVVGGMDSPNTPSPPSTVTTEQNSPYYRPEQTVSFPAKTAAPVVVPLLPRSHSDSTLDIKSVGTLMRLRRLR